ncbi:MAG: hypothetical protein ACI8TF_001094 [Paracoccaceae bacterium]|jgi:uncharacterized protein YjiS (DUF1127 family)
MQMLHSGIVSLGYCASAALGYLQSYRSERKQRFARQNADGADIGRPEKETTMAYLSGARTGAVSITDRLGEIYSQASEAYSKWRVYRNTFNELRELGDREIADLGLARSSLRRVALEAAYGTDHLV